MNRNLNLQRVVIEIFGGCNYTCQMCPQSTPGREKQFLRKMPLKQFEEILDQITPKYGKPVINLEGSGEPTMATDLPAYIEACTRRGLPSFIYSNGSKFSDSLMKDSIDAGLTLFRFSVIGYNREMYAKWMDVDNWDLIYNNASQTRDYIKTTGSKCNLDSYHLILDPAQVEYEVEQYQTNFVFPVGTEGFIWKMHNWSGNYSPEYNRKGQRRSCGRPAADELTIRAGGINGHRAAVTPCCQVLGPPNESASVLGHFDNQSFEEIYFGDLYNDLRKKHEEGRFDEISYCKDCDFLYDDAEVLVWSNSPTAKVGQMLGTTIEVKQ
jgi:MoaA/NifB/PqqE/SkfB family radical SAM enzyme